MKKRLMLLLSLVLVFALALTACGEKAKEEPKQEKENATEQKDEKNEETKDEGKSEDAVEKVDVKKVFVSAEWVKSVIDGKQDESKKFVIAEAAWGSAADSPDYNNGHLPGAIHVDTASIEGEPLWNIKTPEEVEKALCDAGITHDTVVILYGPDPSGVARVAHAYLWAGVENVKILNGSLNAWKAAGYELEKEPNEAKPVKEFGVKVPAHPEFVLSLEDAKKNLEGNDNFKLVSIRSYDEFIGKTSGYSYIPKAGEPKGAVWGKGGSDAYHMEDYVKEDGTYINLDEMKALWSELDFSLENELSFYCGTGWRASIPFLIMYENGYENMSVYDGGWFEWQSHDELDCQVGDPRDKDKVKYPKVGELANEKKEN